MVRGILFFRTWLRKVSWRFCARSPAIEVASQTRRRRSWLSGRQYGCPHIRAVGDRHSYYRANLAVTQGVSLTSVASEGDFPWIAPSATDPEGLQLAVQRRSFHADELRGPGDISAETCDLREKILAFEDLARIPQGKAHQLLA